jgi:hypothetical protein
MTDTPNSLNFEAILDKRVSTAQDVAAALEQGDLNQCSCSFVVADDEWSDDFSRRTVRAFASLHDLSIVTNPAYPSTQTGLVDRQTTDDTPCDCSCALCVTDNDKQHCVNCPAYAGDQGDQTGEDPSPSGAQDGSGSRSARRRQFKEDLERLAPRRKPTRQLRLEVELLELELGRSKRRR